MSRRRPVNNHRTAVVSQIRGLLLDRGFAFAKSITRARRVIPALLSDMTNGLTGMAREAIAELLDLMCDLDRRVAVIGKKIDAVFKDNPACHRIARIKDVGPKTTTTMVAAIGDGADFKNGRHLAAWLGLVPQQHSSGDKRVTVSQNAVANICAACWCMARGLSCEPRRTNATRRTNGSMSFGSDAASTKQWLRR